MMGRRDNSREGTVRTTRPAAALIGLVMAVATHALVPATVSGSISLVKAGLHAGPVEAIVPVGRDHRRADDCGRGTPKGG